MCSRVPAEPEKCFLFEHFSGFLYLFENGLMVFIFGFQKKEALKIARPSHYFSRNPKPIGKTNTKFSNRLLNAIFFFNLAILNIRLILNQGYIQSIK